MTPPFERTVCACPACTAHCLTRPGYLIGQDIVRLSDFLLAEGRISEPDEVLQHLTASYGAVVAKQGRLFQIGTITPKMRDGRCVFLGPDDRCTVHAVAPFGCAYFDHHMPGAEGDQRSSWGLHQIIADPEYQKLREALITRDQITPVRLY